MKDKDLSFLLASSIHDMKNSLGLMLHTIDQAGDLSNLSQDQILEGLATLRYESMRLNNDLLHLLGVYRYRENQLPVSLDEQDIEDILEEQYYRNETLLKKRKINFELHQEVEYWDFDSELVGGVLNNVIVNSIRYTKDKMKLSAIKEGEYLVLRLEDNGEGFPTNMIEAPIESLNQINFRTGSTSLGLYFAAKVAQIHEKNGNHGYIKLENGGHLGGGVFSIYIP